MQKLEKTLLTATPNPWSYSVSGIVMLASLLISLWYWRTDPGSEFLTAGRHQVFQLHEYWRLFTTTLVHADLKHFLSNAIFFWVFGYLLNGYFGAWVFPVLSLLMGGVINALTLAFYPDHAVLLGASGVVYFMAAFWATLFYQVERGEKHIKRMMSVLGVSLILFFPSTFEPQVSYLAHAWGFAMGIISGLLYFQLNRKKIQSHEQWRETETATPTTDVEVSMSDGSVEWIPVEKAEVISEPCNQLMKASCCG
jgi:rhomboid protease GluP